MSVEIEGYGEIEGAGFEIHDASFSSCLIGHARLERLWTGASHSPDGPRHIRRFTVASEGRSLDGGEVFAECSGGLFDGFRFDTDGRIWSSAADGVHCLNRDGHLIGKIGVPEVVSTLTFGGKRRNRLFIFGNTSLYSVYLAIDGAALG